MTELLKILRKEKKNEWVSGIIPGLLFHMCLSIVYCWSLVKVDIDSHVVGNTSWAFSIMVFVLALTSIFSREYAERKTKDAARYGAVLFSLGMIGSGLSCQLNSLNGLYFFFGVCLGIGAGLIYVVPLKMLSKWFRGNKKSGLGKIFLLLSALSSFIMVPSVKSLVEDTGIVPTFTIFGIICLGVLMMASWLLEEPDPIDGLVEETNRTINTKKAKICRLTKTLKDIHELPGLVVLWLILFINLSCGLALISCERDVMLVSGFSVITGMALARVAMPIGKSLTRPLLSFLGNKNIYKSWRFIFIVNLIACLIAVVSRNGMWFSVILINLGYGASFTVQPRLIADLYGKRKVSRIHNFLLTAWACAGLFGNQISEQVYASGGGPTSMMVILGVMSIIGLGLSLGFKWTYKLEKKNK